MGPLVGLSGVASSGRKSNRLSIGSITGIAAVKGSTTSEQPEHSTEDVVVLVDKYLVLVGAERGPKTGWIVVHEAVDWAFAAENAQKRYMRLVIEVIFLDAYIGE